MFSFDLWYHVKWMAMIFKLNLKIKCWRCNKTGAIFFSLYLIIIKVILFIYTLILRNHLWYQQRWFKVSHFLSHYSQTIRCLYNRIVTAHVPQPLLGLPVPVSVNFPNTLLGPLCAVAHIRKKLAVEWESLWTAARHISRHSRGTNLNLVTIFCPNKRVSFCFVTELAIFSIPKLGIWSPS